MGARGDQRKQAEAKLLGKGWKRQKSNPKHKYVYLLDKKDKALRRRIEAMRQPYPKRTPTGGASEPTEAGGSTPTRPLQIAGQTAHVL